MQFVRKKGLVVGKPVDSKDVVRDRSLLLTIRKY